MMDPEKKTSGKKSKWYLAAGIVLGAAALAVGLFYRDELWQALGQFYAIISDRQRMQTFISSFGVGAPVVFIVLQVLQVVFAREGLREGNHHFYYCCWHGSPAPPRVLERPVAWFL